MTPQAASDYANTLEGMIAAEAPDLVVTVGFRMGDATARSARNHPDIRFAIVDNDVQSRIGVRGDGRGLLRAEGGLSTVTSLMFAEDQVAYLAGVLAGCMTETGTVATVGGVEIPPVVRFVTGFENGARAFSGRTSRTLHQYIPDFNDPDTGKTVAQGFINAGADVIFGAGGNTGNGGLLAALEAGVMAIGVDVDQYLTYPEVGAVLLTSAAKNVDVAAAAAVRDFANGSLRAGCACTPWPTARSDSLRTTTGRTDPGRVQGRRDGRRGAVKADPAITGGR